MSLLDKAEAFARMAHEGQTYGDQSYMFHVMSVVGVLRQHGFRSEEYVAAGWLHDTLEDCEDVSLEMLKAEFGDRVAELVYGVTNELGKNRRERNAKTYPKIASIPGCVPIKLADRIANVSSCWITRDTKLFMYHREYKGFRDALRREEDSQTVLAMWGRLDKMLGWWEPPKR